jgi:hypothetical protein
MNMGARVWRVRRAVKERLDDYGTTKEIPKQA